MKYRHRSLLSAAVLLIAGTVTSQGVDPKPETGQTTASTLSAGSAAVERDRILFKRAGARVFAACKETTDPCLLCICEQLKRQQPPAEYVTSASLQNMIEACPACPDNFGQIIGVFIGGEGDPNSQCVP
ncbi:MAG: hypothetical protein ACR2IE_13065 [Candidatus Sumerlaeaceae bacterium]